MNNSLFAAKALFRMTVVLSAALLAGCGGGTASSGAGGERNVPATEAAAAGKAAGAAVTLEFPAAPDSAEVKIDLGKMSAGEVIERNFAVRNRGKEPFVILEAERSCGCTGVDFPKKPIRPGETAFGSFTYDSAGKRGAQSGTITLTTSRHERFVIRLEALVE